MRPPMDRFVADAMRIASAGGRFVKAYRAAREESRILSGVRIFGVAFRGRKICAVGGPESSGGLAASGFSGSR